jgi:6-phospho-3-hexuloisomerase
VNPALAVATIAPIQAISWPMPPPITSVSATDPRIAKAEGARVVALTRAPASTLATIADTVLTVPVGQTEQFGGSLFEQSCILLLDGVVLGLAQDIPGAHEIMLSRHANMQ